MWRLCGRTVILSSNTFALIKVLERPILLQVYVEIPPFRARNIRF